MNNAALDGPAFVKKRGLVIALYKVSTFPAVDPAQFNNANNFSNPVFDKIAW
jgi:hypothetical protein